MCVRIMACSVHVCVLHASSCSVHALCQCPACRCLLSPGRSRAVWHMDQAGGGRGSLPDPLHLQPAAASGGGPHAGPELLSLVEVPMQARAWP